MIKIIQMFQQLFKPGRRYVSTYYKIDLDKKYINQYEVVSNKFSGTDKTDAYKWVESERDNEETELITKIKLNDEEVKKLKNLLDDILSSENGDIHYEDKEKIEKWQIISHNYSDVYVSENDYIKEFISIIN